MTLATFNATSAANIWLNNDNLVVKFGTTEGRPDTGGEMDAYGMPWSITEVRLNVTTDLTATAGTLVGTGYNVNFPAQAIFQQIEVISEIACTSGGSPVVNIGTAKSLDKSIVATNNLLLALPLTSINAAGKYTLIQQGAGTAGTLIGASTGATFPVTLVADNGGTAFTAGKLLVRFYYYVPDLNPFNQ